MELTLRGLDDRYAAEQLLLALFPEKPEGSAAVTLTRSETVVSVSAEITLGDRTSTADGTLDAQSETVRLRRRLLQQTLYRAALPLLPEPPPWGALAGVRPTKLTTRHLLDGGDEHSAHRMLEEEYFVTPARRKLAVDCSLETAKAVRSLKPEELSLYIGIPFCPTRCAYCSFVSRGIGKKTELLEPYLEGLLQELEVTGRLLAASGKRVRTVYIGGGTPTTLTASQLSRLMDAVNQNIDLSHCTEFTVEAGRPDTLDSEKFRVLREKGADRVSINPQSMNDDVLRACGRVHRAEDIPRAYQEALDAGFREINMDLIAGLPGDTAEGFRESLDRVLEMAPSNITVHTLALKKDADLFGSGRPLPAQEDVAQMLDYASRALTEKGYAPYYLYRQKYMSGSFENVGWCRDGKVCLYNICMMEELHTILSLGGGGMTKVNLPDGTLRRFHNPKFPEQYLSMLPGILSQKEEIFRAMEESFSPVEP